MTEVESEEPKYKLECIREDRELCVDIRLPDPSLFSFLQDMNSVPTIFFIHGSMATKNQFYDLLSLLQNKYPGYRYILYDAYGCGNSPKPYSPESYTTTHLIDDAIAIYDKYKTKKNLIISHSFGTSITASLMNILESRDNKDGNNKEEVSCVLLGTADFKEKSAIFYLPIFFLDWIRDYLSRGFIALAFSPATTEEHKQKCLDVNAKNLMYVVKFFYSGMTWATVEHWNSLKRMCGKERILIVQGKDDKLTEPQLAKNLCNILFDDNNYQNQNQNNYVEVEDAGHMLMQEKSQQVFEIISKFFQKVL